MMPDTKIHIGDIQRIAKFLTNKKFLRYYMSFQGDQDIQYYLKDFFIERFGEKILKYVMDGNQDATNAILNQCPEILGYRGNLSLPNGVVTNVSALELIQKHTAILDIILSHPYNMAYEGHREVFGNALLYHAIRGNQDVVVKILHYYPRLLSYQGNVVDYSGREFKNVTALELATWALDVRHMAPAMLKCLTENKDGKDYSGELIPELQSQYDNVVKDGGGVNYIIGCGFLKMSEDPRTLLPGKSDEERYALLNRKLNRHDGLIQFEGKLFYFHNLKSPKKLVEITNPEDITALEGLINKKERKLEVDTLQIINHDDELKMIQANVPDSRHIFKEKHYEFKPLIDALDEYFHSFDAGSTWTWEHREAHWCTVVGLAQHYAPAHVAHHYCNPDESFDPKYNNTPPTFDEKVLERMLNFESWVSNETEPWWPASDVSGSNVLGLDIGIARGRGGWWARGGSSVVFMMMETVSRGDFAALTALCEMRTSDVLELKQLLDSLQKPETGSEPARAGPA